MKYIIATHGKMASGIKNTIEMLAGEKRDLYTIDAYVDSQEFSEVFEQLLSKFGDEYVYVFTDIVSGSVNQQICKFLDRYRLHVITGMNLPVIMEIILRNEELNEEEIEILIEEARQHILYMNRLC